MKMEGWQEHIGGSFRDCSSMASMIVIYCNSMKTIRLGAYTVKTDILMHETSSLNTRKKPSSFNLYFMHRNDTSSWFDFTSYPSLHCTASNCQYLYGPSGNCILDCAVWKMYDVLVAVIFMHWFTNNMTRTESPLIMWFKTLTQRRFFFCLFSNQVNQFLYKS